MTSSVRTVLVFAALLVLPAGVAACSGGSTKAAPAAAGSATDGQGSPSTLTPTQQPGTAPGPTTGAAHQANAPGSTVQATRGGAFCKSVADLRNDAGRQAVAAGSPDAARKAFEDSKKKGEQALSDAPGEIKPDIQTLLQASSAMGDALAKANFDMTKVDPNVGAAFATPAVQTANAHVQAFVKQHCGFDLNTGAPAA